MHSKKVVVNSLFGVIYKLTTLILGFITRKIFIHYMGSELLGLNSLFTDLLSFLNLADLGIGVSVQFSLYKPLAENNEDRIVSIVNTTRNIFNVIGIGIMLGGLLLTFFLDYLIANNPYDISFLRIVFMLNVLSISLTYFIAHKKIFLQAKEEIYLVNITDTVTQLLGMILKVFAVLLFKSYYLFVIVSILCTLVSNIVIRKTCDKRYPYLNRTVIYPDDRKKLFLSLKDVIPLKLGMYLYTSTDNVIISSFLGLASVAAYSNYMLIINSVMQFCYMIAEAFKVSFGNLAYETGSIEKLAKYFNTYLFLQYLMSSFCATSLLCLLDPFIRLVFGNSFVIPFSCVAALALDFFIHSLYQPLSMVFGALGKFKEDKTITLGIDVVNIALSLVLIKPLGILGPILGTLFSNTITWIFRIYQIVYLEFKMSVKAFVWRIAKYFCSFFSIILVCYWGCSCVKNSEITGFLIKIIICAVIPNLLNLIIWYRTAEFHNTAKKVIRMRISNGN